MSHKNKSNWSPLKKKYQSKDGVHKKPTVIYPLQEANDRLEDIFRNHGFSHVTHEQRIQLAHFYVLLMEKQRKENFTRLLSLRDIAIKHFIDCLIVPQMTLLKFPLMDLGTGPGFPGIPLKILFPFEKIILAEGVQKRVEFLKIIRSTLGLNELDILGRNIQSDFSYALNGVITRAVEEIHNTLTKVAFCLPKGGRVYLMKGPSVNSEIEMAKAKGLGPFILKENLSYELPRTPHQRRLLVYEKVK